MLAFPQPWRLACPGPAPAPGSGDAPPGLATVCRAGAAQSEQVPGRSKRRPCSPQPVSPPPSPASSQPAFQGGMIHCTDEKRRCRERLSAAECALNTGVSDSKPVLLIPMPPHNHVGPPDQGVVHPSRWSPSQPAMPSSPLLQPADPRFFCRTELPWEAFASWAGRGVPPPQPRTDASCSRSWRTPLMPFLDSWSPLWAGVSPRG